MRGSDDRSEGLFSYASCEARVPARHPLRVIRAIVDEALDILSPDFSGLYAPIGRPSIAPEKLLRALLQQPRVKTLLSDEHFSVDGALILAWASMKSFTPKDTGDSSDDDNDDAPPPNRKGAQRRARFQR